MPVWKHVLLLVLIFICKQLSAQNLVPNPSFEDVNICTEIKQPCSPSGWFYINNKPKGYTDRSKLPGVDGNSHLNLLVIDTSRTERDYWQTRLLCSLQAGEKYKVSFKVTSVSKYFHLRDIGFYFSNAMILASKDTLLQSQEYLSFIDATIKRRRKGWHEVEIDFIPTKNFTHLIIGNFSMKTNRELTVQNELVSRWSIIAIDDISISPGNRVRCEDMSSIKDSLYGIKSRHSTPSKPTKKPNYDTIVIENIEFDFDSAVIKNEDMLEYLKPYLMDSSIKLLTIVGFTDNSGTALYNRDLSRRRASSVRQYLQEKLKIKAPMEIKGNGISRKYPDPQRNRRVEIWIHR